MSNLEVGIVGLPNVGKSTLFNAITKAGAESANYPFCTIEPNVGVVAVPDERLSVLTNLYHSKKTTPASIRFVDIAGLVKGASKGEGLGNKFLEHIRQVDAVAHVVRCFDSTDITHVEGSVDPLRDISIIETELCLADLESVEKRIAKVTKLLKSGSKEAKEEYLPLPSHSECLADKDKFIEAFHTFYLNCDPITAKGLCQKCDDRYLIQNPPSESYSEEIMDKIYSMEFARDVHPYYKKMGAVRALDTIKYSVTTHRGCYGECNFCAIAIHQGRTIMSRSQSSIVEEVKNIAETPKFHGNISDVGGPTANMYGLECKKKLKLGACPDRRCLYPKKCPHLQVNHNNQVELLKKLKKIPNIKKIFIASGIRYDMILDDNKCGQMYLKEIIKDHISGQMKIAPEHTEDKILGLMGKDGKSCLNEFKNQFYKINNELGKKQFLTYYLIAAHPGCKDKDMMDLKKYASQELRVNPEQVQIFTPTPSTYSTLMYYTEKDPFTNQKLFVEKDNGKKQKQKDIVTEKRRK